MNYEALEKILKEDDSIYKCREQKLIQSAKQLLTMNQDTILQDNLEGEIIKLQQNGIHIDNQVKQIQNEAFETIRGFEQLKNQKKNVELVINTLNSYLELQNIKDQLPKSIQKKDIVQCTKLGQTFNEIEKVVMKEFCQKEYEYVQKLYKEDLIQFQKEEFEQAVKKNDLDKLNECSGLARVLHLELSLEKIKEIHAKELRKSLQQLEEQKQNKNIIEDKYNFPFLDHFVCILQLIQPEKFISNVQEYYGIEGVLDMIKYLISDISQPYLIGVLKQMNTYFSIDKMIKSQKQVQSYDNQLLQAISKKINLDDKSIGKISLYCEELATISSDYKSFITEIQEMLKIKEPIQTKIEESITEQLAKYLDYSIIEMQSKLVQIVSKSESLDSLWNFDKSKFNHLVVIKEPLKGNGFHEWLEEIFFLIYDQIQRVLLTDNQVISSAHINFIGFQVIADDLHQISLQLFHRYLKKEYFSPNAIGITADYTVNNSFIILIFNILSSIPTYLRTLKSQLYSQLPKSLNMIVGAVEELIDSNCIKFKKLIEEKMRLLADNLLRTIKDNFDEIRSLSFNSNEVVMAEQEREYQKLFSTQFKQALKGIGQYQTQMVAENYDLLLQYLSTLVARNLEQIIMHKQYHSLGAIILEKEVRNIVNYFQLISQSHNVKQSFVRLQLICETLLLESYKDMEEFVNSCAVQELNMEELRKIQNLRIDLQQQQQKS